MNDIPHPVGSIIQSRTTGLRLLIASQWYGECDGEVAHYSTLGHPDLGFHPQSSEPLPHSQVEILEQPSVESWRLLRDALRIDEASNAIEQELPPLD